MTIRGHASQTLHLSAIRLRCMACSLFVSNASNNWSGLSGLLLRLNTSAREKTNRRGNIPGNYAIPSIAGMMRG